MPGTTSRNSQCGRITERNSSKEEEGKEEASSVHSIQSNSRNPRNVDHILLHTWETRGLLRRPGAQEPNRQTQRPEHVRMPATSAIPEAARVIHPAAQKYNGACSKSENATEKRSWRKQTTSSLEKKIERVTQNHEIKRSLRFHYGRTPKPLIFMIWGFLDVSMTPTTNFFNLWRH